MVLEKLDIHRESKMNLNSYHIPYSKTNLKFIIDLYIKANTIKVPEEYIEESSCLLGVGRFLRPEKSIHHKRKELINCTS